MTKFRFIRVATLFLLAVALFPGVAAAQLVQDESRIAEINDRLQRPSRLSSMSQYDRLRSVRIAPGSFSEDFVRRQKADGYNAVALSDALGYDAFERNYKRVTPEQIAESLMLARKYDMSVIVCIPAVVPVPVSTNSLSKANASLHGARFESFAPRRAPAPAQIAAHGAEAQSASHEMIYLSDEEFAARVGQWALYDQGEIIGAYFLGDDAFFLEIPRERQKRWAEISAAVAPQIHVGALAGEFSLHVSEETARLYWTLEGTDFVLIISYPHNLGFLIGRPFNHVTSPNPDAELVGYIRHYFAALRDRLFEGRNPTQLIVPVIQTFYYQGEPAGSIPRIRDIELQARTVHNELQVSYGQRGNFSMGYFYAGTSDTTSPWPVPRGIYDVPGWAEAVATENARLEAAFRNSAAPVRRRAISRP